MDSMGWTGMSQGNQQCSWQPGPCWEKGNFHALLAVLSLSRFHSWLIISLAANQGKRHTA